ncbi:MAG: FkbM family methyltransferase [Lactobacillales bacterium]|jgi:FkbM family methyltransferase|nr:FkbM family methyltransferase [Lactobacillales bacterium]
MKKKNLMLVGVGCVVLFAAGVFLGCLSASKDRLREAGEVCVQMKADIRRQKMDKEADKYRFVFRRHGYDLSHDGQRYLINGKGLFLGSSSKNFLFTANEVLNEEGYKTDITAPTVIIDIGLNVGVTALYFARMKNVVHVYGFEPFWPTYWEARANMKDNPALAKKITIYPLGLSDKNEMQTFDYNPDMMGSMSTVSNKYDRRDLKSETVEIRDASNALRTIFKRHPENIMLKVDCEGAEFEIFKSLDKSGLLKKVSYVVMEYHDRDPKILLDILKKNGFEIVEFTKRKEGKRGIIRASQEVVRAI